MASAYDNGKVKNYTTGMCGFKYQVTNVGTSGPIGFVVMKDSAVTLLAGSALALAAMLAFWLDHTLQTKLPLSSQGLSLKAEKPCFNFKQIVLYQKPPILIIS